MMEKDWRIKRYFVEDHTWVYVTSGYKERPDPKPEAPARLRGRTRKSTMDLSIVIPIKDERDDLGPLLERLHATLDPLHQSYEIIFVDDGSSDGSHAVLESLALRDPAVKVVQLHRNFGQSAALQAGIDWSSGDVLVTMDGDCKTTRRTSPIAGQAERGLRCGLGLRAKRQDSLWVRKVPSLLGNWLIRQVTGVAIRDMGCTLRAMRRDLAEALPLYGEMHRFVPVLAQTVRRPVGAGSGGPSSADRRQNQVRLDADVSRDTRSDNGEVLAQLSDAADARDGPGGADVHGTGLSEPVGDDRHEMPQSAPVHDRQSAAVA